MKKQALRVAIILAFVASYHAVEYLLGFESTILIILAALQMDLVEIKNQ